MAGGLLQLAGVGVQDVYLTGNPQITFFKAVYRRHTNFAVQVVEYNLTGNVSFGGKATVKFNKSGDLINKMYLKVVVDGVDPNGSSFAWVRRLGHAVLDRADVKIGGTVIDSQYGTWLDVWYELARYGDLERGYDVMIGDVPEMVGYNSEVKPEYVLYIPMKFWFNRHVGLSIPIIALQYHDVEVDVHFSEVNKLIVKDCRFDKLVGMNRLSIKSASVLADFVYLDSEERRRFAVVGHEYLIEQVQFDGVDQVVTDDMRYRVGFNHATKEMIWAVKRGDYVSGKRFVYYTGDDVWDVEEAACFIINGSVSVGVDPRKCGGGGDNMDNVDEYKHLWYEVQPCSSSSVGRWNVENRSEEVVYVNPCSLMVGDYGITNKIKADITVTENGCIVCDCVETELTVRDLSIPVCRMTDTRFNACDPEVYQFNNYGLLIDGSENPVDFAQIRFNGQDRFDRREGAYFNYVQPDMCHSNTPADGINVYSFALHPEEIQPSGTANLSRLDMVELLVWFRDSTSECSDLPVLDVADEDSQFYMFGVNYNVLRFMSGLSGLAYVT